MNTRIVVKIGTESLNDFHTSIKIDKLVSAIRNRISTTDILLVTSGAVQFGRITLGQEKHEQENKQVLAAVGWHSLMSAYTQKLHPHGIHTAGFLVTHADIEDNHDKAITLKGSIIDTWNQGILPIVNENDPISTEEMREIGRGADNDKNAFLLAKLFGAQTLIIITNTNGVYEQYDDPNSRIKLLSHDVLTPKYITTLCNGKSSSGTGGMSSKLDIANQAGNIGIRTHIGDGIHSGLHNTMYNGTNIIPGNIHFH